MKIAEVRRVQPAKVQHFVLPEEAFPYIVNSEAVAFMVKSGALRIARNGVTIRPFNENDLLLKTCLVSHKETRSKVVSELMRAFMLKLKNMSKTQSLPPRKPVQALKETDHQLTESFGTI